MADIYNEYIERLRYYSLISSYVATLSTVIDALLFALSFIKELPEWISRSISLFNFIISGILTLLIISSRGRISSMQETAFHQTRTEEVRTEITTEEARREIERINELTGRKTSFRKMSLGRRPSIVMREEEDEVKVEPYS